jgi:hypothetical protein
MSILASDEEPQNNPTLSVVGRFSSLFDDRPGPGNARSEHG